MKRPEHFCPGPLLALTSGVHVGLPMLALATFDQGNVQQYFDSVNR